MGKTAKHPAIKNIRFTPAPATRFAVRYAGKLIGYETGTDKAAALAKVIARNPNHLPGSFELTLDA